MSKIVEMANFSILDLVVFSMQAIASIPTPYLGNGTPEPNQTLQQGRIYSGVVQRRAIFELFQKLSKWRIFLNFGLSRF